MRRAVGKGVLLASRASAWTFWTLLALWAGALAFSDRFHATQFIAFVPDIAWLFATGAALGAWTVLGWRVRACDAPARRRLRFGAGVWALAGLCVAFGQWHLHRALLGNTRHEQTVRIVVWNAGVSKVADLHERLLALRPDVVLIANPHVVADWVALRDGMGGPTHAVREGSLVCVSRLSVRQFAWTGLGVSPEHGRPDWWPLPVGSSRGGEALYLRLAAPAFADGLVIWFLDLPSDPWASRTRIMQEARRSIEGCTAPAMTRDDAGRDVPDTAPGAFGPPDLVVGDLNTPRGCRSVWILSPGLRDATADAGWGLLGTFPRSVPVLSIDRALAGARVRIVGYGTVDFGDGYHLGQVIDLAPAER